MEEVIFIMFVAIVVLVIAVIRMNSRNQELNSRLSRMEYQYKDLLGKAFYNYQQIKGINYKLELTEEENRKIAETIKTPVVTSAPQHPPVHNTYDGTASAADKYGRVNPYAARQGNPPEGLSAAQSAITEPVRNSAAVNAQAAKTVPAEAQRAAAPVMRQAESTNTPYTKRVAAVQNAVHVNTPQSAVQQSSPHIKEKADSAQHMTVERWLGTRLFNIVASLLIFIGLILFCTLGYEYITDGMKIAAMHTVSIGFIAVGGYFTRKNRSVFSLGLTGCGLGSFFIAILLTHIYFNAINDVTAFSLLLIWIMLALFLSKKLDSLMMSITAHIGMAVSVCFAFSLGFSADRLILPVVYQTASIAIIIIGNVICCKKTYRFGLFVSMALLIYSSAVMTSVFIKPGVVPLDVSAGFACALYAVQTAAICFVSYLISVSSANLEKSECRIKEIPYAVHIVNKILWSAGVIETLGSIVYIICRSSYGEEGIFYPSIAVCAAAAAHMLVTLFMSEKLNFSEKLSKISFYFISILVTITLFIQASDRAILHGVPFLFVYTCLIMAVIKYTKNKKLNHLVSFLIGCEMAYMCFYGYNAAANVVTSILYMVIIGALMLLHWFSQSGKSRQSRFVLFKTAEYLWISASIIPINVSEFSNISLPLILSEFAVMSIIAHLCRYASENERMLRNVVKAEAFITIYVSFIAAALAGSGSLGDVTAIKMAFVITTAVSAVMYSFDLAKKKSTVLQMTAAATLSGYITSLLIGFGKSLVIAEIVTMGCIPFFFLAAVFAFAIYMYNKNIKLSFALLFPLVMDMTFMMFNGYEIFHDSVKGKEVFFTVIMGVICVLHCIAVCAVLYVLWHTQPKTEDRRLYVTSLKGIAYYWLMFAVISLCEAFQIKEVYGAWYPFSLALVFIVIINIAALWFGYGKDRTLGKENARSSVFERVIRITSTIALYIAMLNMCLKISEKYADINYAIRFAMIITSLALFYMLARYFIKKQKVSYQLLICITATIFVNAVCRGIPILSEIMYIYSIVSMVVALVCIIAGFISNAKGMRIYGLVLIMLCVLKLVTVDISSENSMSRVLAFVVGGIVCFIISGIYNFVERRFSEVKS